MDGPPSKRARFTPLATLGPAQTLTVTAQADLQDVPAEVDTVTLTTPLADPSVINTLPFVTTLRVNNREFGRRNGFSEAFVDALTTNSTLETLDLSHSGLPKDAGLAITRALGSNTTLTSLTLQEFDASLMFENADGLGEAVAAALARNTTLTTLNLSKLYGNGNVVVVADTLGSNTTLTSLDISNDWIGDAAAVAFAGALARNTSLMSLDISANQLEDGAGFAFANALEINTTLTELNIAHNILREAAGAAVAAALARNSTLTSLNISWNHLGSGLAGGGGGVAFADALERNTTLTELNIKGNSFENDVGMAFAGALERNSTLTSLDISSNYLLRNGVGVAFADALERNTTLVELNLKSTSISQPVLDNIREKLAGREPPYIPYTGPYVKAAVAATLRANAQFWGGP